MKPASPKRSVRILGNLLVLLFGITMALAVAEVLIRLVAPHPRYFYYMVPDEKVGMKYKPGHRGRTTNIFGEFDTLIQINQEGFRDREYSEAKPSNRYRVAFLGDSFTAAEQVEEQECFVRLTEKLLNEKRPEGKQIECINFGVGGYEIQQYVLCYEAYVRKYKPDLVVVAIFVHNDFLGNAFYQMEKQFGRPYFRLADHSLEFVPADMEKLTENYDRIARRLKVRWYHHLHVYNAQKQIFWAIRQQKRKAEREGQQLSLEELWKQAGNRNYRYYVKEGSDPIVIEADRLSQLLLKRLESAVHADGAALRIILLPADENLTPEKWPERLKTLPGLENIPMDFNRPYEKIATYLPEMQAQGQILDLRPALREALNQGPVFFPRDSHYNRNGHAVVAKATAAWLDRNLSTSGVNDSASPR